MKKLLLSLLILLSKSAFSCGFYPGGDEVRMSIFDPSSFNYLDYADFNYSFTSFKPRAEINNPNFSGNDSLWQQYCNGKVSLADIDAFMNDLNAEDIIAQSNNAFIQYLIKQHKNEAIQYLRFAKTCEPFNVQDGFDPWEKNEDFFLEKRKELIAQAKQFASNSKEEFTKRRYAFLAIRMMYYNNEDKGAVDSVFSEYFSTQKDYLYYCALYFKALTENDHRLSNVQLSMVFKYVPEKRFAVYQHFDDSVKLETVLPFAKSAPEKAAIYELYAFHKPDKAIDYLQHIYALNPNDNELNFYY